MSNASCNNRALLLFLLLRSALSSEIVLASLCYTISGFCLCFGIHSTLEGENS